MHDLDGYREKFKRSFFLQFIYHGTFGIGTFFAISGILQTYGVLTKVSKNTKDGSGPPVRFDLQFWVCLIVNRYLRIIPLYLFCILYVSYVLPQMANFSMWSPMDPGRQCPPEIWRHLFFLNNFKPLQLCMTWTWYLAVDFQLFLTNVPLTVSFVHRPKLALAGALSLILPFSLVKAFMIRKENFPPALMLLVPMPAYDQNFAKYSFEIYMRPYSWTSTYLFGMLTGYLIFWTTTTNRLSNGRRIFGRREICVISLLSFFSVLGAFWTAFGIYPQAMGIKNLTYDFIYAAFSPLTWALSICWLVYSIHCFLDKGSIVRLFLQYKIWTVTSNLTFACYLIHLPFCFGFLLRYCLEKWDLIHSSGRQFLKVPLNSSDILGLAACAGFVSYFLALALYFLVESPAAQIQAILMGKLRDWRKMSRNLSVNDENASSRIDCGKEGFGRLFAAYKTVFSLRSEYVSGTFHEDQAKTMTETLQLAHYLAIDLAHQLSIDLPQTLAQHLPLDLSRYLAQN
uniref:Acyltransferase 3 domain-containing protein n=1 Tax=Romanomermis culicivorax TaxID=13658 RepID=A0A915HHL9_ROMCU